MIVFFHKVVGLNLIPSLVCGIICDVLIAATLVKLIGGL